MSLEDRQELIATVQETCALMGRALNVAPPDAISEPIAVRPDVIGQIRQVYIDSYVTDQQMLLLLQRAYFDLLQNVLQLGSVLLGPNGEGYDTGIASVGLTGSGRAVKIRGFRQSLAEGLSGAPGFRWVKRAFKWGNIILGSLSAVPGIGIIAEPIQELKESIEAQGDDDQNSET
jgi:hypothetical protein